MEEVKEKKVKWVEAQDVPEGEKVYLKKDWLGWRVVEPIPEGASLWRKLMGSKRNQFICLVVIIGALLWWLGTSELISNYKVIAEAPCDFCSQCRQTVSNLSQLNFTFPKLS